MAVERHLGDGGIDTVFEMEISTNRPDAMNHYGVAREASALYNVPLKADCAETACSQGGVAGVTITVGDGRFVRDSRRA